MRKFFVGLLFLFIGAGAFAAFWLLFWVNPQEVVSTALVNLAKTKTVQNVRVSVFWDLRHPSGQGYVFQKWMSYAGSLDVTDPTHPKAQGVIGYTLDPTGKNFQTSDVNLLQNAVYFRLGDDASPELSTWFADAASRVSKAAVAATTTGSPGTEGSATVPSSTFAENATTTSATSTASVSKAWYAFQRSTLMKKAGVASWIGKGTGADVRTALLSAQVGSWAVAGPAKTAVVAKRTIMTVALRPQASAVEAGLISLIHAWMKRDPTGPEFDWASRSAAGISKGKWVAVIDTTTRTIQELQGTYLLINENGELAGHVTVDVTFEGMNAPVSVKVPVESIDLTSMIEEKGPTTFAPSGERPIIVKPPVVEATSSTSVTTTRQ